MRNVGTVRALHDRYAGPLYVFAYRRLGDRQAAEEVVQDTLVRAWRHADDYDPERGSVATWLFGIARNLVIDQARSRAARTRSLMSAPPPQMVDTGGEIDRMLETWQVAEALAELSTAHRDVIIACYHRGYPVVDAAELLGVPVGTVKSRLYYGLRALRLKLEEMGVVG